MSESRTTKDMFDRRLRFTNISESDRGDYQCMAQNSQGKATYTYTVTVEGTSLTHTRANGSKYSPTLVECEVSDKTRISV